MKSSPSSLLAGDHCSLTIPHPVQTLGYSQNYAQNGGVEPGITIREIFGRTADAALSLSITLSGIGSSPYLPSTDVRWLRGWRRFFPVSKALLPTDLATLLFQTLTLRLKGGFEVSIATLNEAPFLWESSVYTFVFLSRLVTPQLKTLSLITFFRCLQARYASATWIPGVTQAVCRARKLENLTLVVPSIPSHRITDFLEEYGASFVRWHYLHPDPCKSSLQPYPQLGLDSAGSQTASHDELNRRLDMIENEEMTPLTVDITTARFTEMIHFWHPKGFESKS